VREVLPHKERLALDRAIIERDPATDSLAAIHRRFNLKSHKIGMDAFRRYARQIEAEGRDYFLATLLGQLFGRIDGSKRLQLHEAAQNMMAGLVLKAVRAQEGEPALDELAKLVRINLDLRKAAAISLERTALGRAAGKKSNAGASITEGIARQIRQLYGMDVLADSRAATSSKETGGKTKSTEGNR
jgi:hypothetical protein